MSMATAAVGRSAPPFRAPSSNGQTLDLDAFVGKVRVVLVFFADMTGPLSQAALADLDEHLVDFGHERVQLLAIAPCTAREARTVSEERRLALTLLADEHGGEGLGPIASAFVGAIGPESVAVVVIDRSGTVVDRFDQSPVGDLAERILRRVEQASHDEAPTEVRGR